MPCDRITITESRKCDRCFAEMKVGDRATKFGVAGGLMLVVCESCDDDYRERNSGVSDEQRLRRLVSKYLPQ